MAANWGLRGKSVVALLLACALALVPAVLLGWRAMDDIRTHFGLAYAKNFTLLHRQKILAPVSRELALSRRFAESVVTRDWLLKEDDPARRALFFREAEGYRGDFRDHAYFIIASGSQHYYFNDGSQPYSERPRYTLEAGDPEDAWYFNTLRNSAAYNINVNVDSKLNLTKVWFNLVIRDQGRPIGLAGSGLDLSGFLDDFIIAREPGVTPMIVGDDGAIQAHPDRRLIAYSSAAGGASERHRVFDLLDQPEQRDALREAMRLARAKAGSVHCLWAGLDGRQQLFAVAYIPQLRWYVLTAVDLHAAQVLDNRWLWPLAGTFLLLLVALLLGFAYAVERLLLRPLRSLKRSAKAIAAGRYDTPLPLARQDEIGSLSKAFASMADQVRRHTAELEDKVQERTQALEEANREMAAAQKKIGDSLDYASLIQRAILPDRQLSATLGEHHFILWKPRDVVGGDFYVPRAGRRLPDRRGRLRRSRRARRADDHARPRRHRPRHRGGGQPRPGGDPRRDRPGDAQHAQPGADPPGAGHQHGCRAGLGRPPAPPAGLRRGEDLAVRQRRRGGPGTQGRAPGDRRQAPWRLPQHRGTAGAGLDLLPEHRRFPRPGRRRTRLRLRQPALRRHAPRPRAAAAPRAGRGLRGDARRVPGRAPATRRHHHPVLPIRLGAPMETLDLLAMRESYTRQRILLCFNGPISRSLIEEIGHALRNYLHAEQAKPSEAMDVFAVYIEMTQNIRHYANLKGYGEHEAAATVAIARNEDGHYVVSAGNLVERDDGQSLVRSIQAIANLDKAALKAAYKEQLRRPRDSGCASGAGLGLLDIARKSSEPLAASLKEQPDGRAFFSLRAVI